MRRPSAHRKQMRDSAWRRFTVVRAKGWSSPRGPYFNCTSVSLLACSIFRFSSVHVVAAGMLCCAHVYALCHHRSLQGRDGGGCLRCWRTGRPPCFLPHDWHVFIALSPCETISRKMYVMGLQPWTPTSWLFEYTQSQLLHGRYVHVWYGCSHLLRF